MEQMVGGEVVLIDILLYFAISLAVFAILDLYAGKRLGGKQALGYQALRIPKFISLMTVGVVSVVIGVLFFGGLTVKGSSVTFFGVPYFSMWLFYMVCVFRRIRAEKNRDRY